MVPSSIQFKEGDKTGNNLGNWSKRQMKCGNSNAKRGASCFPLFIHAKMYTHTYWVPNSGQSPRETIRNMFQGTKLEPTLLCRDRIARSWPYLTRSWVQSAWKKLWESIEYLALAVSVLAWRSRFSFKVSYTEA